MTKIMKVLGLLFLFLGLNAFAFQTHAQSTLNESNQVLVSPLEIKVTLPVVGKAGATISSSGKIKICPGWAWNICASITITINLFDKHSSIEETCKNASIPSEIDIYDENGRVIDVVFATGEIICPQKFNSVESLKELTAEDILLK
jgi:hypothetical protein